MTSSSVHRPVVPKKNEFFEFLVVPSKYLESITASITGPRCQSFRPGGSTAEIGDSVRQALNKKAPKPLQARCPHRGYKAIEALVLT
ncbi:hypothetical protein CC1G_15368 [Coprinopsis cinerea okayama7|uniref:Uncharacterized protein n=1 Tax=Coprinopsis cinerea (strain Okayama-7 / 130 / ATCC MYA-4618 / FGSC 9003) TaxID=240176 RepID=D6RQR2_COPC7|nr:hypothetical protein CC1G_15368 [Coprinopsis cinerea okayama7\|eukprot:XP_002910090.1 hypothetical protein CC1G_15368 [Coprinopsis cinerea okayama7\